MNKQKVETLLQKKLKSQGDVPTFFDNLIYDLGIKEEDEKIYSPILNLWEQLLNSKSNRFSSYENRSRENCSLSNKKRTMSWIQTATSQGTHSLIKWKDLGLYKSVYDLVIYWMLISELKPNTIVEYGSGLGGSAIWLADISSVMGFDTDVISYDINPPNMLHPKVDFVNLDLVQDFVILERWRGKKLVIEDAHVNVKEVLLKTDLLLREGDYLIIEDSEKKESEIVDFLSNAKNKYKVDNYYLDFFGRNTTCSIDSIFKVF